MRINAILRDYPSLTSCQLHKLTPEHLARWRDDRLQQVQSPTVAREMNLVASVIEHARREWRWLSSNPARDVRKPPNNRPRDQRITDEQANEIAHALGFNESQPQTMSAEVGLMFLLSIETAMRAGEFIELEWSRVHLKKRYLTLNQTKNGNKRDVPLSARAIQLLTLMHAKNDTTVFTVSNGSRDVLFRNGKPDHLKHIHFHDARHEAVTRLASKLDVLELARMIGHRDLKSLMIYYNKSASEIADKL